MEQAITIGLDIAKHVFQAHGADAAGHALFRKRLTRTKLLGFLATQAPCVVAMEACAGSHYWGREIGKLGHTVRLIPTAVGARGKQASARLTDRHPQDRQQQLAILGVAKRGGARHHYTSK